MKLTIRKKLIIAFLAIGLVPAAALGWLTWKTTEDLKVSTAKEFETIATGVADKIDRNLFERYGDVQAFGLNRAVQNRDDWYKSAESNPIVQSMNRYVDTYDIYYLTILVDKNGKLIAVNTRDDQGQPIDTSKLYDMDFKNEPWFKDALAGRFYESKDGSFTGTVVEHLYVDPNVKSIYNDDALSLGFTAPVKDENGNVIAVWKNVAKFSLVEEILLTTYKNLKSRGMGSAEITLLDGKGNVIIDCDPSKIGEEKVVHDMQVIGKFNLASKNVEAATEAVKDKSGSLAKCWNARKEIYQTAGFTPLRGALGFPGMKWNVLVRVPMDESLAAINEVRSTAVIFLICLLYTSDAADEN